MVKVVVVTPMHATEVLFAHNTLKFILLDNEITNKSQIIGIPNDYIETIELLSLRLLELLRCATIRTTH